MAAYNLLEGGTMNISLSVSPGWRWKISVVPKNQDVDFNLYISDMAGNLVAQDDSPDADAHCTFDATGDGKYSALVESVRGSSEYSLDINPVSASSAPQEEVSEESAPEKTETSEEESQETSSSGVTIKEVLKRKINKDEKKALLQAHNEWRARYGVGPLEWSKKLTKESKKWAKKLAKGGFKLEHSPRPPRTSGENLAYGGNTNLVSRDGDLTPEAVVDLWGNEVNDYDYETNTCAPGKVCGHYTQVVWKDTQFLGGASFKAIVEDASGNESVQEVWVCNYDPPGNFVGQKPY